MNCNKSELKHRVKNLNRSAVSLAVGALLMSTYSNAAVIADQNFNDLISGNTFTSDQVESGGALTNAGAINVEGAGLDFATYWFDTRDEVTGPSVGTESGDFIGVNDFTGSNAPGVSDAGVAVATGVEHNFQFNDADGRLDLVFEAVDVSNFENRTLTLNYWLADTGYESDDFFIVSLSDGDTSVELYNISEVDLEALSTGDNAEAGEWNTLSVDLEDVISTNSLGSNLTLTVSADTNSGSENIFVDDIEFAGDEVFQELYISEYIEGSSFNKAIEIYNPNSSEQLLDGYELQIFFNGSSSAGTTIDLAERTVSGGDVFVVADDSADAAILAETDLESTSSFFNGDDAVALLKDGVIVDVIGQIGTDPGSEWGTGDISTANNTIRRLTSVTTGDTDGSDAFDPTTEWEGFASNTFDDLGTYNGSSDGGDDGGDDEVEIGACFDTELDNFSYISGVQGSDSASEYEGEVVIVEGVVTGLRADGYFLQEEISDEDEDATTSEGIFVSATELPVVGNTVRVVGTVGEFFDLTRIAGVTDTLDCGEGSTVTTVPVTMPLPEGESLEHYEGMMVSVTDLVVFDTDTLWQYGELGLSNEVKQQPTDLYAPLTAEYEQQILDNQSNIIYVEDDNSTTYPDALSFFSGFSYANPIGISDTVSAVGPLNYSFSLYRVNPIEEITVVNQREAAPSLDEGDVKIATFNVLNYFNGQDDGEGGVTFDYSANRGAEDLEEFELQEARIVEAIVAMDADVIGLMEIENDGFGEDSAIQSLVDAVNVLLSEENQYSFVGTADSSLVGTDAIAVGVIYRESVVMPIEDAIEIDMPTQLQEDDSSLQQMRVSLLQTFRHLESREDFAVVVNHFKSKGSGCYEDAVSTTELDSIQGSCNALRVSAAVTLGDALEAADLPERVMILGDLNAYSAEDPLAVLTDYDPVERGYTITTAVRTELDEGESVEITDTYGFENVAEVFDADGYSYWFYGTQQVGSLDHVLASPAFMEDIVDATHWNINSVEVYQLQYDQALSYYRDEDGYAFTDVGPYRSSDHDPFIVSVSFASEAVEGDVNGDGIVDMNDYSAFIAAYGSTEDSDNYNVAADLNEDGVVNMIDFQAWYQIYLASL